MIRFYIMKWKLLVLWLLIFSSCHKSDPVHPQVDRTVLIYMAADNSLSGDGSGNIKSMLQGMSGISGRVVIYFDPANDVPHLLTIENGNSIDTLRTYPEENSASPEVLGRVVEETRTLFPANSYGLILWSHGMAWLPENYSFPGGYSLKKVNANRPRTKYFGEDRHPGEQSGSSYMSIEQLAQALPDQLFDFILFDACFMSSMEVLYELRTKASYFIASPAEVIADGFPYEHIMPHLWGDENELELLCLAFYNYYNTHANGGDWQSGAVALVKAGELEELMVRTRAILLDRIHPIMQGSYPDVWRYPLSTSALPDVFYDFREYMRNLGEGSALEALERQLDRTVIYKKTTPSLFGSVVPEDKYSGISVYIPQQRWNAMNNYYSTLSWFQAVY